MSIPFPQLCLPFIITKYARFTSPHLGALFESVYKYSLLQMFYLNTKNTHFSTECINSRMEVCGVGKNSTESGVSLWRCGFSYMFVTGPWLDTLVSFSEDASWSWRWGNEIFHFPLMDGRLVWVRILLL